MDTERYLKLAVLATVLIIALVYPVFAALALTGVAAWHLEDFKISRCIGEARLTPARCCARCGADSGHEST